MRPDRDLGRPADGSAPTLLLVSLLAVSVGVAAVIAIAMTSAGWAVPAGLAVVVLGLVLVARVMTAQLGDDRDDDIAPEPRAR